MTRSLAIAFILDATPSVYPIIDGRMNPFGKC
jgi:hypothetical protein